MSKDIPANKPTRGGKRPNAGRPRVYESPAARVAAHRQRLQAKAAAHAAALEALADLPALTHEQRQVLQDAAQFLRK